MDKLREEFEAYKRFAISDILSVSGKSKLIEVISKHIDTSLQLGQIPNAIPDGWVLVPKEPTEAMIVASFGHRHAGDDYCIADIYKAMIEVVERNYE